MRTRSEIEAVVRRLIARQLGTGVDPESLASDVPIFRGGFGMDSMSAVHLMTAIEKEFSVRIEDDEFDIFDSLERLVEYLSGMPDADS